MTLEEFTDCALSLPGTESAPHFDRTAFKVRGKRIFATIDALGNTANLKLTPVDQSVFSDFGDAIYPVPNKWGQQGWTTFEINKVPDELMRDAVETAYRDVVGK